MRPEPGIHDVAHARKSGRVTEREPMPQPGTLSSFRTVSSTIARTHALLSSVGGAGRSPSAGAGRGSSGRGDAARIHSPVGRQGMNLGMQDAFTLAAALAQDEAAVDRRAAERHRIARRVLLATELGTRLTASRGSMAAMLRRSGARLVARRRSFARASERALAGRDYPPPPARAVPAIN